MRFQDWATKVREEQKRLEAIQLGTARESIMLEGKSITVELTALKGRLVFEDGNQTKEVSTIDAIGKWTDARLGVSEIFRRYQLEFDGLLTDLVKQVDTLVSSFTALYSMIVERDIPELVMNRIAGAGGSAVGTNQCVQEVAQARMIKQVNDLASRVPWSVILKFDVADEISGKALEISWDMADLRVSWGDIQIVKRWGQVPIMEAVSLNMTLLYLANGGAIQVYMDKTVEAANAASAVIQGFTREIVDVRR